MAIGRRKVEVKRWLRGQKMAAQKIEAERARFLLQLTAEKSLQIYLSLQPTVSRDRRALTKPSPLLWAMRRTLEEYQKARTAVRKRKGR